MPTGHYQRPSLIERFWPKVEQRGPDECWPWKGSTGGKGYGQVQGSAGRLVHAHRVAYELTFGAIPIGLDCCHHCDNPGCCNPRHLFVGTRSDNMQDAKTKGRFHGPPHPSGDAHPRAKLTSEAVRQIRERVGAGEYQSDLAREFGVSQQAVWRAIRGLSWRTA